MAEWLRHKVLGLEVRGWFELWLAFFNYFFAHFYPVVTIPRLGFASYFCCL